MLTDAHNHIHDKRLDACRDEFLRDLPNHGLRAAVVNGTQQSDWPAVAALAARVLWVTPSFGLHPWYVNSRTPDWHDVFLSMLDTHPGCGVGEIGLDRWIEGHDLHTQSECFTWQLGIATERNLAATIHCVRAWGALWDVIRKSPLPSRGILLHAYGGPAEMVPGFVERGAYFSFSPYFLHERKAPQRAVFAQIPPERLLVETDAPDLAPPPERNPHPLPDFEGKPVNHPANIETSFAALAEIRKMRVETLADLVAENFKRLFGSVQPRL